jgi:hypothetical protein
MKLIAQPGITKTREQFRKENPIHSIALDGYVSWAPNWDLDSKHFNFNHHEDVNRLMTRCTAEQVLMAIKGGLMDCLRVGGTPEANIYVNDPDQDSTLAAWMLLNWHRIEQQKNEPALSALIAIQDKLDTTGGLYPMDLQSQKIQQLNRVFAPYTEAKKSGAIRGMSAQTMHDLIMTMGERIEKYTQGEAQEVPSDTTYTKLGGGLGRLLIQEFGNNSRNQLALDHVDTFVSFLYEGDGKYYYSIGKRSPFIQFPLEQLYTHLNNLEEANIRWWSDTIGGCRNHGSTFSPTELEWVINKFLQVKSVLF